MHKGACSQGHGAGLQRVAQQGRDRVPGDLRLGFLRLAEEPAHREPGCPGGEPTKGEDRQEAALPEHDQQRCGGRRLEGRRLVHGAQLPARLQPEQREVQEGARGARAGAPAPDNRHRVARAASLLGRVARHHGRRPRDLRGNGRPRLAQVHDPGRHRPRDAHAARPEAVRGGVPPGAGNHTRLHLRDDHQRHQAPGRRGGVRVHVPADGDQAQGDGAGDPVPRPGRPREGEVAAAQGPRPVHRFRDLGGVQPVQGHEAGAQGGAVRQARRRAPLLDVPNVEHAPGRGALEQRALARVRRGPRHLRDSRQLQRGPRRVAWRGVHRRRP